MADPDWIGPPVESAWWQLDGASVNYRVKRAGTERRDLHSVALASGEDRVLSPAEQVLLDGPDPIIDVDRRRALTLREGSLFLRDLASNTLRQITAGTPPVERAAFAADGAGVHFRRDGVWYRWTPATGVPVALTDLRMEESPLEPREGSLEPDQLRLFKTLQDDIEEARAAEREAIAAARADVARPVPPWYLGKRHQVADSALSADGRWLLLTVEEKVNPATQRDGRQDRMPRFVTRSGYVEVEDVRTLVGRKPQVPQALWLLDLANRQRHTLSFDGLKGLHRDPLAKLKSAQDIDPYDRDRPRPLGVMRIDWHPTEAVAAVMLRAVDNKDRWIATLAPDGEEAPALTQRHRLTDPAWINWAFNELGWIPGTRDFWFLSEESGYGHLYRASDRGRIRQITAGEFEVSSVIATPDGTAAIAISNRRHPTETDLWRIAFSDGTMQRLTDLKGVESFARHPLSGDLLIRHSQPYVPAQVSVLDGASNTLRQLTDTRTAAYRDVEWQQPAFVGVASRHGAGAPIWTKFYPARAAAPGGGKHPAVVFVHGAGYTQNTHHRFPYYFREQMFHNLLTARGYHVIDMDYRASEGYGRDWRTAIYRRMGTPELEDLIDGVAWLVDEHNVDPGRVGVYGGSYGGFMTLMAMFKAPQVFSAGASLRPVTDWSSYNHGYTSNILNTPQVDPEAYRRSSPIELAEGLAGDLLIAHGMLDDNVFYKDSVRLAQRLIELEKTDWELAGYPMEPHGFIHAPAWLDEYRRILKLFERTIGKAEPGRSAE
jgi:dipeptidyl aminopeptidase/acylaminoacyl peptidase